MTPNWIWTPNSQKYPVYTKYFLKLGYMLWGSRQASLYAISGVMWVKIFLSYGHMLTKRNKNRKKSKIYLRTDGRRTDDGQQMTGDGHPRHDSSSTVQ